MTDTRNPFCHQQFNNASQIVSKKWQKHRGKTGNYKYNPYDKTTKYDESSQLQ